VTAFPTTRQNDSFDHWEAPRASPEMPVASHALTSFKILILFFMLKDHNALDKTINNKKNNMKRQKRPSTEFFFTSCAFK
jgi:hypothetical protein